MSQHWSVRPVHFQVSSFAPLHHPPAIFVNRERPWRITRKVCHGAGLSRCPVLATTCTHVEAFSMSEFRPALAQDPCRWVLSHLNRACWLGVWPPLQISSHRSGLHTSYLSLRSEQLFWLLCSCKIQNCGRHQTCFR